MSAVVTQASHSNRPRTPWAFAGALAGLVLALCDVVDFVAFEHARFRPSTILALVGTSVLLLSCFGVVVGVLIEGASLLARRWHLPRSRCRLALGTWLLVSTGLMLVAYPTMVLGLGRSSVAIVIVGAGALVVVGGTRERLGRASWVAFFVWAIGLEMFVAYPFSRAWPGWELRLASVSAWASFGHSLGLAQALGVGVVVIRKMFPHLVIHPCSRRKKHAVCLVMPLFFVLPFGVRLGLERGANELRLAAFERTRLTYRALSLVPFPDHDVARARTDARCEPPLEPNTSPTVEGDALVRGVVVIIVDTFRTDRLGARRDGVPLTPHLEALREQSLVFERAYTTQPSTKTALAALVAGRFVTRAGDAELEDSLGPFLARHGVSSAVVAAHPFLEPSLGRFESFELIGDRAHVRARLTGEETYRRTADRLARLDREEPFVLVAHFYDPHAYWLDNDLVDFGVGEAARYDAEIVYTDHWIGRLLRELETGPHAGDTAVVVLSDHGEELGDHHYAHHRKRLYDESARMMLSLRFPGQDPGVVGVPVSMVDVAPTVLRLLGLPPLPRGRGRSLVGPVDEDRIVHMRAADGSAWGSVQHDLKVIYHPHTGVIEAYDLAADPREDHPLGLHTRGLRARTCELLEWGAAL